MPSNRTLRVRKPKTQQPAWVDDFLAGILPQKDTEAHDQLIGWKYFDEEIPGLPKPNSNEGRELMGRAHANSTQK